jgi:hypothetical protein
MKQPDIDEINNYLISMKHIIKNNGTIHVKKDRNKNYIFLFLYGIADEYIKNVLLNLKAQDFYRVVKSTNEFHTNEILYEWRKQLELTAMDGSIDYRDVYIKTYIDEHNNTVVVISFHKDKDYS